MQQPSGSGGGGSQSAVPPSEMTPFSSTGAGLRVHSLQQQHQQQAPSVAEAASPINSQPPSGIDELAPSVGTGNSPDDEEALAAEAAGGEEAERGGASGNRWPRQETLALLKIRSDMDAAFRDSALKGPLWEDVSRKLAELGYKRSAKKCKEKFENVHKYYKRTKEARAGRQDGKSYRFFRQLEALYSGGVGGVTAPATADGVAPDQINFSAPTMAAAGPSGTTTMQPLPISSVPPLPISGPTGFSRTAATAAAVVGLSFSSNSSSSSSDSDGEDTEDAGGSRDEGARKRKRGGSVSRSTKKMMTFFHGLMKQVMEKQEAMQQWFLETIEKREQDRVIREEAWRRQEMARLNREQEVLAKERAVAANRDNALISYLQKITGQTTPMSNAPSVGTISVTALAPRTPHVPPAPPQALQQPPQPSQHSDQQQAQKKSLMAVQPLQQHPPPPPPRQKQHQNTNITRHQPSVTELVGEVEPQDTGGTVGLDPVSSSRWPRAEVDALIKVRSGFESRYQEAGPKGPLWEEISAAMQSLGYNRSAKRCKEKWENINKYFKKVKESNKKRPEDAKTCPYFHQLDALYRKKHLDTAAGTSRATVTVELSRRQEQEAEPTTAPPQEQQQCPPPDGDKNGNNGKGSNGTASNGRKSNSDGAGGSGDAEALNSNGFMEEGAKKPEDAVKELMEQRHPQNMTNGYDKLDDADGGNMEQDNDDEDDEEDRTNMQYNFQRSNVSNDVGNGI